MMAPFEMSTALTLGFALVFGFLFGLFLERGGMGDPHKLSGIFYLTDFAVPKLMFTAIVVASTGLYLLSDLNLLDLTRVWIIPTFFLAAARGRLDLWSRFCRERLLSGHGNGGLRIRKARCPGYNARNYSGLRPVCGDVSGV